MQISTEVTESYGMCLVVTYGPVRLSVIFDATDEDTVMKALQQGFEEVRRAREDSHVHAH